MKLIMENWNKLREEYRDDDDLEAGQADSAAYEALANNVAAWIHGTLKESGLSPAAIRQAVGEALEGALGPVEDEGPRVTSTGPWAPEKL